MSIEDITVRIFKYRSAQDLAVWMQARGWMMIVLSLGGRMIWIQAMKDGRKVEAEVRGLSDVETACAVLKSEVLALEDRAARTAA